MKHISMSKTLAAVGFSVFMLGSLARATNTGNGVSIGGPDPEETKRQYIEKADEIRRRFREDCDKLRKEMTDSYAKFFSHCKVDEVDNKKTKSQDVAKKCADHIKTCRSIVTEESGLLGMTQIAGLENVDFGDDTAKQCSLYSEDKYQTELRALRERFDLKNKDYKEAEVKKGTDQKEADEEANGVMEKFITEQEKKAEADMKAKNSAKEQEATFDRRMEEYDGRIAAVESEIMNIQQQQAIVTLRRGREVTIYRLEVEKCRMEIKKTYGEPVTAMRMSATLKALTAERKARIEGMKTTWQACTAKALENRVTEALGYKSGMETLAMSLQSKTAQIQKLKESKFKLQRMFADSIVEQQRFNETQEKAFFQKQQDKLIQMDSARRRAETRAFQNQRVIAQAQQEVIEASNHVRDLEAQEPLGDKAYSEIRNESETWNSAKEVYEARCSEKAVKANDEEAKKFEDRGAEVTRPAGTAR